jgi:CheY-like chemotaxis protein
MPERAIFLLVEDDENDVLLIRRAFTKAHVLNPLYSVKSGEEAIEYLAGEGAYSNRAEFPLPALVLLDLKMRGLTGFDVLRWIRQQPGLRTLRVVILTASDDMRDVSSAYQMGANSFLIKPLDFERFVEVSQAISGYWLWLSESPDIPRVTAVRREEGEPAPEFRTPVRHVGG